MAKIKSLYGDQELTLNSFNVWVIYRIKTLEHSMVSLFLILDRPESLNEILIERILKNVSNGVMIRDKVGNFGQFDDY